MKIFDYPSAVAIIVLTLLVSSLYFYHLPPAVKSTDIPSNQFSGARALQMLKELLVEGKPHPVGSNINLRIRERLFQRLDAFRFEVEVQRAFDCHYVWRDCAWVENVLGYLPGSDPNAKAVLLMAHYDSVPASIGAGDDGAGMVALLEVARILATEKPFPRPLLILFTDAEESGLLGAEAFFNQHPLAKEVAFVLNVEGSGTTGLSRLLRTGPNSGALVDAYAASAPKLSANSLSVEVFKRIPNDTDFSVAQRFGLPGLDFAFAGERNHYHTPLDNLDNLNPGVIQHHGDNLLGLTRDLLNNKVSDSTTGELAYADIFGVFMLRWPISWTTPLASIAFVIVILMIAWLRFANRLRYVEMLKGLGVTVLMVAGITITGLLIMQAITLWHGELSSWPAHGIVWQSLVWSIAIFLGLRLSLLFYLCGYWATVSSICLFWTLLALLISTNMPSAAPAFLIPALAGALIYGPLALSKKRDSRRMKTAAGAFMLFITGYFCITLYFASEQTQGYKLSILMFVNLSLLMTVIGTLSYNSASNFVRLIYRLAGLSMAGLLISVLWLPMYSENRPKHLNLTHFSDLDTEIYTWVISTRNELPASLKKVLPFQPAIGPLYPWYTPEKTQNDGYRAPTEAVSATAPRVIKMSQTETEQGRIIKMRLALGPQAQAGYLFIPASRIDQIYVEGIRLNPRQLDSERSRYSDWLSISIKNLPAAGVTFTVEVRGKSPMEIMAVEELAGLTVEGRETLQNQRDRIPATPVQRGDTTMILKRHEV
ncbi:MAG: M20/M25/M40 family metallo-hydrolase [Pseudomonadota bacterium]